MVSVLQIVCTLEIERTTDRDEGFLKLKEAQANEQYKIIISVLGVAAPKWEFDNKNFVVSNRGFAVESLSTPSSKHLMYQKERKIDSCQSCDKGIKHTVG